MSRRTLLAGLGAGVALSPLVPLLESHAEDGARPKRLIVFHTPHGLAYDEWLPTGTETNWSLSPVLAPLAAFKDKLVVVTGLSNEAAKNSAGQDHNKALRSLLTSREVSAEEKHGGISIDQEVANALGGESLVKSLHTGVISDSNLVFSAGENQGIASESNPAEVYAKLFSDIGGDDASLGKLRADRQSVISLVRSDLKRLETRVSTSDRHKIEEHLAGIARIEDGLAKLGQVPGTCVVPEAPTGFQATNPGDIPLLAKLQLDLMVAALACDVTRVATVDFQGAQLAYTFLDITQPYHDCCHLGAKQSGALHPELIQLSTWFSEQFALLLGGLDAIEEDGGTLLDNTLVVWCTFMADGRHSWDEMPITLAGGAGGALTTNRFKKYSGQTLNDLWISVARLTGHDIDTFGNPAYVKGALPGLG